MDARKSWETLRELELFVRHQHLLPLLVEEKRRLMQAAVHEEEPLRPERRDAHPPVIFLPFETLNDVLQTWACGVPIATTCVLAGTREPVQVVFVPCMLPLAGC